MSLSKTWELTIVCPFDPQLSYASSSLFLCQHFPPLSNLQFHEFFFANHSQIWFCKKFSSFKILYIGSYFENINCITLFLFLLNAHKCPLVKLNTGFQILFFQLKSLRSFILILKVLYLTDKHNRSHFNYKQWIRTYSLFLSSIIKLYTSSIVLMNPLIAGVFLHGNVMVSPCPFIWSTLYTNSGIISVSWSIYFMSSFKFL